MTFTITGAPATKKNSPRILRAGRRRFVAPSAAAKRWERLAIKQLRAQRGLPPAPAPPTIPAETALFNLRALVYREKRVGDLLNYLAAVSDALERAFIVANDRQIVSVDGCRLLHDKKNPRVEIELTALADQPERPRRRQVLMFEGEELEFRA